MQQTRARAGAVVQTFPLMPALVDTNSDDGNGTKRRKVGLWSPQRTLVNEGDRPKHRRQTSKPAFTISGADQTSRQQYSSNTGKHVASNVPRVQADMSGDVT